MILEEGLYHHLRNDTEIRSLIGPRLYPGRAPRGQVYPYLTYNRITSERYWSLDEGPCGLVRGRVQIDTWSDNYDTGRELSELVRLALDGFSGSMLEVTIQGIFLFNEFESYDKPKSGEEMGIYRCTHDYIVWFEEALS